MRNKVVVVIVTYNRADLLRECLNSILAQDASIFKIVVIDNASTDSTASMLQHDYTDPRFIIKRMNKNLGGAGGFYEGIKCAREFNPNWIWVMDDDTIPNPDSLSTLLNASVDGNTSFLASCVFGPSGEPMNVPRISDATENGYSEWYRYLCSGLVQIRDATFVSVLIKYEAVNKCGLPCPDFFIWGDDTEYTYRLTKYYGPAYLVGASHVCHKRYNAKAINLKYETNEGRIKLFHYHYRNNLIFTRLYKGYFSYLLNILRFVIEATVLLSSKHGIIKFASVMRGIIEAIIGYNKFSKYIKIQLKECQL